jgi:hypothetical protein
MSSFSAMRLFLALRLTRVRLIAHVTMPLATMIMVAPSTIHPPQATCGTNSRMSTRKASRETRSVGKVKISSARRYRGEWAGEWKWAATARPKQIRVMKAATGCTMRIEDRACRDAAGSEKSGVGASLNRRSARMVSLRFLSVSALEATYQCRTRSWDRHTGHSDSIPTRQS